MKKINKAIAGALALVSVISAASCGGSNSGGRAAGGDTTTPVPADESQAAVTTAGTTVTTETNDTDAAVQELAASTEVDNELHPQKKLKWLSWWAIDESSAEVELFKANYGIPEQGSKEYGEDNADKVFVYTTVDYQSRYDRLGKMIAAGDSPDIFEFEIGYFPLSAYSGKPPTARLYSVTISPANPRSTP